jgi:hypothetical protein
LIYFPPGKFVLSAKHALYLVTASDSELLLSNFTLIQVEIALNSSYLAYRNLGIACTDCLCCVEREPETSYYDIAYVIK